MKDFDKIIQAARALDVAALERNVKNQEQLLALREHNTYGRSKFFQTKDELAGLADRLKETAESPEFSLFRNVADAKTEEDLENEQDKLLFTLRQELGKLYENNRKYTEIRDGFNKETLNETVQREQNCFIDTLSSIQTVDGILDKLMRYDVSDSAEFDSLYVAFNNVRKRYSDVAEGSLNIIQDSYYKGQKVYKITGKEPLTNVALAKKVSREAEKKADNEEFRENLQAVWEKESEPLFSHDPCPEDVMQGCIGDCYLVAALASIAAQNPDRIREMIKLRHVEEKDPADPAKTVTSTVAVVRLYTDRNEPVDVTVPYTSCYLKGTLNGQPFSEPLYASGAAWVKMIEKAIVVSGLHSGAINRDDFHAAVRGNYRPDVEVIRGGHSHTTMQTLLGPEMTDLFQGKANLRGNEIQLPSTNMCNDFDAERAKMKGIQCQNATKILNENGSQLKKAKNSIRKYIENNYISSVDLTEEGVFDAIVKELVENPDGADRYFRLKEGSSASAPAAYFKHVQPKTKAFIDKIESAQKVLDKWDPAKSKRPEKFPPEYVDGEIKLYDRLLGDYLEGKPLAAARPDDIKDDEEYENAAGLPFNHAYSITRVFTAPDGVKYVEVRNPHNKGGRAYDETGKAVHDPDTSRMGISQVELRDFCRTFERVYVGNYDPKMTYTENASDRREMRDLYGDALMSICRIIDQSDTFKKSAQYNELREASKILMKDLQDPKISSNALEASVSTLFIKAKAYKDHRDDENAVRTRNKISAANRYVAADAVLMIRDLLTRNADKKPEKRERANVNVILKECKTIRPGDNIVRKSSIEVLAELEARTDAKKDAAEKAARDKAAAQGNRVFENAKSLLARGIREVNEKDVVTAVSTMVYVDDVRNAAKDLSAGVLADKVSRDGIKRGTGYLQKPVTEALKEILSEYRRTDPEHGQEKFLNALAEDGAPVRMIRELWKKQIAARHPDAVEEAGKDQVVKVVL